MAASLASPSADYFIKSALPFLKPNKFCKQVPPLLLQRAKLL